MNNANALVRKITKATERMIALSGNKLTKRWCYVVELNVLDGKSHAGSKKIIYKLYWRSRDVMILLLDGECYRA